MPDPHDTLSIFAEVSVALAGFSGIVIAFGRRSHGKLTRLERRRLANLFGASGVVLLLSLTAISLLHIAGLDLPTLWLAGSVFILVVGIPWLVVDWRKVGKLEPDERVQVKGYVIYPFLGAAGLVVVLQFLNVLFLHEAWPFFLALVLLLVGAIQQFVLLVQMGFHDD